MSKREFIYQSQVSYIEYIIVTRDMENLGISRKEVIQKVSYIAQAGSCVQSDNRLDFLFR